MTGYSVHEEPKIRRDFPTLQQIKGSVLPKDSWSSLEKVYTEQLMVDDDPEWAITRARPLIVLSQNNGM